MATEWVPNINEQGEPGWTVIVDGITHSAVTDPSLWSQTDRVWHATVDGISYRMAEHLPGNAAAPVTPVEMDAPVSMDVQLEQQDEQSVRKRRWPLGRR